LLINRLVVRMSNFIAANVIINNLLHAAINVIKYLNQVIRNYFDVNRNNET
jgi:hypothetical protein